MNFSQVQIVNLALTLLGANRIVAMNDNVKEAREATALWDFVRDALQGAYTWSFTKKRAQLNSTGVAPAFDFANAFNMPADALRIHRFGDYYPGLDLTNYRGAFIASPDYAIESGQILSNYSSPVNVIYCAQIQDTTKWPPVFAMAMAGKLAEALAEPLTQSGSKQQAAAASAKYWITEAIKTNAIELPPEKLPDDEWEASRL